MSKIKKALLVVLIDIVLMGVIIFSVYKMLNTEVGSTAYNVFMALIVISIPVIFFSTYLTVAGDKYDIKESEFKDENTDNVSDTDATTDTDAEA